MEINSYSSPQTGGEPLKPRGSGWRPTLVEVFGGK
jgi:hypothetical protein